MTVELWRSMKVLTQETSHLHVLSVTKFSTKVAIWKSMRELMQKRSHFPVPSVKRHSMTVELWRTKKGLTQKSSHLDVLSVTRLLFERAWNDLYRWEALDLFQVWQGIPWQWSLEVKAGKGPKMNKEELTLKLGKLSCLLKLGVKFCWVRAKFGWVRGKFGWVRANFSWVMTKFDPVFEAKYTKNQVYIGLAAEAISRLCVL